MSRRNSRAAAAAAHAVRERFARAANARLASGDAKKKDIAERWKKKVAFRFVGHMDGILEIDHAPKFRINDAPNEDAKWSLNFCASDCDEMPFISASAVASPAMVLEMLSIVAAGMCVTQQLPAEPATCALRKRILELEKLFAENMKKNEEKIEKPA